MTETRAALFRPSEIPAADRGGGNRTIPLVTRRAGATQLINGITVIAPGSAIQRHFHNCEESVMVLSGEGVAEVAGEEFPVHAQDTTFIPANLPHRFRNASATEPLTIFWTYASVEATRTLVDTGETRSVDSEHARKAG